MGAQELTVSAAASLTNAFPEIGRASKSSIPAPRSSSILPLPALCSSKSLKAPRWTSLLRGSKDHEPGPGEGAHRPASRKNFVSNTLVLIVPQESKLTLAGLEDLASAAVRRVALGNPVTVPVGRYTQEALTKAGLWEN